MEVLRFLHQLTHFDRPSAVAIGNFDGMHLGHQAILKNIQTKAKEKNWCSVVILFEPHPKEFFSPNASPPRLMRLIDKLIFLADFGIDYVICLKFDEKLASLSATHFVEKMLIDRLKIAYLSVGEGFHFGHGRQGSVQYLKQAGLVNHFEVITQAHIHLEGNENKISSTEIRALLNQGKLNEARDQLGHPLCLSGRVIYGNQLGSQLGFPTANIRIRRKMAISGVFAVKVSIENVFFFGVANLGTRPTVDHRSSTQLAFPENCFLEVHLFDFNQSLYGKRIHVHFLQKIREEMRFEGLEQLKKQIAQDVIDVKKILTKNQDSGHPWD